MSRQTRWKISEGSKLKELLLELQIDKENKKKISFREMARTSLKQYLDGESTVSQGMLQYWCKKLSKYEPFPNYSITEKLAYDYAIQQGYWTEDELSYDEFSNNTMKIKNKLDEKLKMKKICEKLDYPLMTIKEGIFSFGEIKNTLVYIYGEKEYNKVEKKVEKEMLKK